MPTLISSLSNLSTSVRSKEQVNVVLYFPKDKDGFERSMSLFKKMCCGLHFPNYSFGEMKGMKKYREIKTHYYCFSETWISQGADSKREDIRKRFKNFDTNAGAFRNYDFLDFQCEAIEGSRDDAHAFQQSLQTEGKYTIRFIEQTDFCDEQEEERDLLHSIWGNSTIFGQLNDDDVIELKCRLEHQHWCAVKLLNGFRALNEVELKLFSKFRLKEKMPISESCHWGMHKEMYDLKRLYASKKDGAHLDLCSFDELFYRDFSTISYDYEHFNQIVKEPKREATREQSFSLRRSLRTPKSWYFYILTLTIIVFVLLHHDGHDYLWNECDSMFFIAFSALAFGLGVTGLIYLAKYMWKIYTKPEDFDRFLANFNKTSLLKVVLFIFSIPCSCAVVACLLSLCHTHGSVFPALTMSDVYDPKGLPSSPNLFWSFYFLFVDPGNQNSVGSHLGLMWALPLALLGVFCLNGFLVSSVINYLERHIQNWREGKTRYHFSHEKHVIIIGGHEMVVGILNQIDRPEIDRFIVMTEQDIEDYREYLCAQIDDCLAKKLVLYRGDRTSRKDIESLYLNDESLLSVYVIGEGKSQDDLELHHDSKSMTCTDLIAQARKKMAYRLLRCYVMFEHRSSFVAFQQAELSEAYRDRLLFEPFNFFEMCVQDLLVHPTDPIRPIDVSRFSEDLQGQKNFIDMDSRRRVHLIIFEMSKIGTALASEAAIICHYPNFAKQELLEDYGIVTGIDKEDLRLRITFIDQEAEQKMRFFQNRMPALFEISNWKYMNGKTSSHFCVTDKLNDSPAGFAYTNLIDQGKPRGHRNFLDVEWEFISGALGDPGVSEYLQGLVPLENEILTVAVCLPNGEAGLSLASTMPVEVYEKAEQILVYQKHTDGIVKQMAGYYKESPIDQKANRYGKLRPFGMYSTCFNQALLDNTLARKIVKQNYIRLKAAIAGHKPTSAVQLTELSELSILDRWSAVYSAHNWSVKFRSMGVISGELPNKELLEKEFKRNQNKIMQTDECCANIWGRLEHNRWNIERLIKIGERPLNTREDDSIEFKESYKKAAQRSHPDICSMKHLSELDREAIEYDIDRNYRLVEIYEALKEN